MAPLMQPLASAGAVAPVIAPNNSKSAKIFIWISLIPPVHQGDLHRFVPKADRNFVASIMTP